ncbi:Defensin domain protein [Aspergillus clavatus NRRL 1]|uniref:Defensin domain protein n=1 Tax=Aspergillus clavatus (strain ATCC 1007 / CBS 513.65 / DSM 816 / NCTC 3887 / NRRL 1 / QM 1276 / 107) TaxID=344612 RepID=A1CDJ7_ASPCL|nr:Defensin domain protein [Aspergillus clavatus NRRL 1]EAW11924.1 Defensin domain protein [Aspergillus clavatus NRRL 1]
MRFALFTPLLAALPLASALCHNSISCALGGDNVCNNVCVRQGNDNGGRCLPRDGCPGYDICACYPRSKRSDEVIDGDAPLREVLKDMGVEDVVNKVDARDVKLDKRSICCSFPDPWGGFCCEDHCSYIGKPGGQCSDKKVCTCN